MSDGSGVGFGFGAAVSLFVVILGGSALWGCPTYNVWSAEMSGKAEYAKAEQNRQITVRMAQAKKDSAQLLADAQITQARGISESNRIIADGLGGPEGYLRYLWIEAMREGKDGTTVIYVPTEAGIPITEADRLNKKK